MAKLMSNTEKHTYRSHQEIRLDSPELILVDGLCPQIRELLPGALYDFNSIGFANNPIATLTEKLAKRHQLGQAVHTLHIVAHGRSGAFLIGGQWVNAEALIANAEHIAQWQIERIALWNCSVGLDRDFISLLSELTGAQVFSTSNHIGTLSGEKNWTIVNSNNGETIHGDTVFSSGVINAWPGHLATKVAVFNQAGLNGSGVGDASDENSNLLSIVQKQIDDGEDYEIELGITSFLIADLESRLADASFFFMTDMENQVPTDNSFLPEAAVDTLKAFVEAGGVMIMTGTFGSDDVDFLNRVFDWDLGSTSGSSWTLDTAAAAGTPFEGGPAALGGPSATDSISKGTVENFSAIYGDDTNATVAVIEFGLGTVIFQGFDFYDTGFATDYGEGTHVNGGQNNDDWVTEILPRSLAFARALAVNTDPSLNSPTTISIEENTTSVLTVTADDADDDVLTFALIGGADVALFNIDSATGALSFNTAPDFESPADGDSDNVYEVDVSVSDGNSGVATQTINITVTETLNTVAETLNLKFNLTQFSNNLEIGYFIVDDADGNVGDLAPGDAGYLAASLAQSTLLFSALPSNANLINAPTATSTRSVNSDSFISFFSIDGNINSLINSGVGTISLLQIEPVSTITDNNFELTIDDITLTVTETNTLPIGVGLQGNIDANVIDLTQITEAVSATFTVQREAAFDNIVGFYIIDDLTGLVTDANGNTFAPGDSGYTSTALSQRVADISLSAGNNSTAQFSAMLEANQIIAPFLVVDGTLEALLDENTNNDPQIYFPFLGSNSDGVDHMRLFGDNTIGFEDMLGGGDNDFDDVLIHMEFS